MKPSKIVALIGAVSIAILYLNSASAIVLYKTIYEKLHYWGEEVDTEIIHCYLSRELRQLTGPPYYGTDIVINIIHILGEIGTINSLEILNEATQHTHPAVREKAEKAISKIQMKN